MNNLIVMPNSTQHNPIQYILICKLSAANCLHSKDNVVNPYLCSLQCEFSSFKKFRHPCKKTKSTGTNYQMIAKSIPLWRATAPLVLRPM